MSRKRFQLLSFCTGRTWWQVRQTAKVDFTGVLPHGVTGKERVLRAQIPCPYQSLSLEKFIGSLCFWVLSQTQFVTPKRSLLIAELYW